MTEAIEEVKVNFTEQQLLLLRPLLKEGIYGKTLEELAVNLLRDYARQMLGQEAA